MKRFLMCVMGMVFALTAFADDEFGLYIVTSSDSTTTTVSTLQKITRCTSTISSQPLRSTWPAT